MRMKKLLTFLTLLTLSIGVTWAANTTVTTSISDYATANNWSNQTRYSSVTMDASITATASSNTNTGNTGKYYSSDNSWRFYANESAKLTINAASGYTLKSVSLTFTVKDNGTISYGDSKLTSGTAISVSGSSAEFAVSQSSGNKGKVFITSISVTYSDGGTTPEPTTYSITGTGAVTGGNVTASATSGITAGTSVTITATPSTGYDLSNLTVDGNDVTSSVNSSYQYTFTMPEHDVAVSATFTEQSTPQPSGSNRFERITNVNQLEAGKRYLLVDETTPAVLGKISNTSTKYGESVTSGFTLNNGVITLSENSSAKVLTLGGAAGLWTFQLDNSYLSWTGGNSLSAASTVSEDTQWIINIANNGEATIRNRNNNERYLRYNYSSPRFACYAPPTNGDLTGRNCYLYVEVEETASDKLYLIGNSLNGVSPWDLTKGVEMTYNSTAGRYATDVYFDGNGNNGVDYFQFAKGIPTDEQNKTNWDALTGRIGADSNGNYVITDNMVNGDYAMGIRSNTPIESFQIPAGLYTVSVDLTNMKCYVKKNPVTMTINNNTSGTTYFEETATATLVSNLTEYAGAKIYYTTDGTDPENSSTRQEYSEAIPITENITIKAIAELNYIKSEVAERTFTKTPKTPVISPESCTFSEPLTVTITCETAGATIRYTLDGTNPTSTSTEYTAPLTISETTTVKARAFVGETYSNGIATAEYVYTEPYVPGEGDFVLVTSKDDLKAGREYIIITKNHDWAMSAVDGDAKKATASQDFTISQDFSTVTLTENSTVNVMKLVDGVEDPDNKYWNLTQANGLNIYVQNTGTGIQEKAHGVGLSGYTDEVMINLTTSTNYAIITSGGRQILYQNGNNGAAGVFGHYANNNQDANGYQRVYLYYREGGEVTPEFKEVTLADLCATGVTTEGSNKYVISDRLVAVYADDVKGVLWCKDEGNASIFPTSIKEGQVDFLKNDSQAQNGRDWDQSNWIALQFSDPNATNNIGLLVKGAVNHYIKAGTIKGTYTDDVNYTLTMDVDQLDLVTPADEGGNVQPDYIPNVYCTSNFLPDNLNIWGDERDGGYTGDPQINTQNYFFMNPKIQEVCEITYAQWDAFNGYFTVPSASGFDGAVQVGWGYNVLGDLRASLQDEHIYKFQAIVQRNNKENYGPKNVTTAFPHITVYPVDLDGTGSDITTAINTVSVNGEVKSVKYVNVAGVVSDAPFQGVNIVVTEYTDGTRTTSKMLRK